MTILTGVIPEHGYVHQFLYSPIFRLPQGTLTISRFTNGDTHEPIIISYSDQTALASRSAKTSLHIKHSFQLQNSCIKLFKGFCAQKSK